MIEGNGQRCFREPRAISQFTDEDIISGQEGFFHGGGGDLVSFHKQDLDGEGTDQGKQYNACPFQGGLKILWQSVASKGPVEPAGEKNIKEYQV